MTRRRWPLLALTLILAAAVLAGVLLVSFHRQPSLRSSVSASLSYSFDPGKGRLDVIVADNRDGRHTVWVVLRRASTGRTQVLFTSYRDGSSGGDQSLSSSPKLAAGRYSWALYQVDRLYVPAKPKYWTGENLVAQGRVIVL